MEVLKANTAQYKSLNGFTNGNSHISFIADELTSTELGILETAIETFLNAI